MVYDVLLLSKYPVVDFYLSEVIYRQHLRSSRVTSCDSAAADIYKLLTNSDLSIEEADRRLTGDEKNLKSIFKQNEVVVLFDLMTDDNITIHSFVLLKEAGENWKILQDYGDDGQENSVLKLLEHNKSIDDLPGLIIEISSTFNNLLKQNYLYNQLSNGSLSEPIIHIDWQAQTLKKSYDELHHAYMHLLHYISLDGHNDEDYITRPNVSFQYSRL